MRRPLLILPLALLAAACDVGTGPEELGLDDVPSPPRDHAAVMVTESLVDGLGRPEMEAGTVYFFPLRTPPPLPELVYDAIIAGGSPVVKINLPSVTATGVYQTSDEDTAMLFGAPNGLVFEPTSSCRINVTDALLGDGTGRLKGHFDCPVTATDIDLRVLVRFDHSP